MQALVNHINDRVKPFVAESRVLIVWNCELFTRVEGARRVHFIDKVCLEVATDTAQHGCLFCLLLLHPGVTQSLGFGVV